jgi:AmmeMemoRadiSam system protein A
MAEADAPTVLAGAAAGGGDGFSAEDRGRVLLALARRAVAESLGLPPAPPEPRDSGTPDNGPAERGVPGEGAAESGAPAAPPPWLNEPGATFVTLVCAGRLRGCVGSIRARRPLGEDVCANARSAAFADPRFPPLTAPEWPETRVEVSLLTPSEPLPAAPTEAAAAALLRPGVDGVVLEYRDQGATFLPQVWEQLGEPRQFLARLKHKAGLPRTFWSPDIRLLRYTVEKWAERE